MNLMITLSTLETEHVWRADFVRLVCTHPPILKAILHSPFFKLHMAINSHQQAIASQTQLFNLYRHTNYDLPVIITLFEHSAVAKR